MTNKEVLDKLEHSRALLEEVYTWASESPNREDIKDSMSVADCAIYDALVALER